MLPVRGPRPGQWWCVSWVTTPLLRIPHPGFGYTTGVGGADIISVNKPCQIKGPLTFLAYHNLLPFFDMRVRGLCKLVTQIKTIMIFPEWVSSSKNLLFSLFNFHDFFFGSNDLIQVHSPLHMGNFAFPKHFVSDLYG